ncbi:ATP synthase F1 subunit gamma [Candidatus Daviesbacteria bacterium RIFCSPLOWO2_01_FULL_43_38]|uniref:ATP synthase gamma chain n=3 Tax=Candidatus Daviesiibacteriota TaxID=1752718 RepID=A0A1F5K496_9BACT|nr:MAG: ATP synthase gamma chain [Candidatus Daviesbacteria bacterium GW2011_GWA1_42_6]KKS71088.1 MAG: ATP synthase gamma chain [Candidatus Daviesbacteria bacterium GW2011_GWA2_42_7]OGE19959.1 MAG: ATP synthase F1 subunit gamma [Candidatus Daviesbacteria bacterium RIFCSPHIGHO2_01_FULL_43_17]OGE35709.1 MAG: ATP synthase F1 subunit gamma [Candidatus Daviesbacteria bacterium RIFCSPHIGHO2_12_FULL_43_11]OGE63397.1 MAG: ATP synthase F1 subunit gamma [Candidatus Daviesbacteria bacterium RIFCSPLOWO2_01
MASTRDLRRRIKSVKNTSQITKAMQMVSATKMRRAQSQALSGRPYSSIISYALSQVSGKIHPEAHKLLMANSSGKVGVLVFSTDKGLCGALNTNLVRLVQSSEFIVAGKKAENIVFYTVGKKGRDFVVRTGKNLEADFESFEHIDFTQAMKLRNFMLRTFDNCEIGEVYLVYPHFVSTLRQEPRLVKLLPVDPNVIRQNDREVAGMTDEGKTGEFIFEPDADQVLDFALTHLVDTQIYQALLETRASEHSARMIAMQNATDNAKDLVSDLTLTYNQVRQGAITNELLEITSAGAALE